MPPVDELERMLGRVLKEGVVVLAVDDEAVGVVEAPDGGCDMEDRAIRIIAGPRIPLHDFGASEEVCTHGPSITSLTFDWQTREGITPVPATQDLDKEAR